MRGEGFRRQRVDPVATLIGACTGRVAEHTGRAYCANAVRAQLRHQVLSRSDVPLLQKR